MAIQFRCPGCSQPIEVDDQYAEQNATCPYCQQVIVVPASSNLDPTPAAAARPVADVGWREAAPRGAYPSGLSDSCSTESLHVGPALTYREQIARTYGNYALICTGMMTALFFGMIIYMLSIAWPMLQVDPDSQPVTDFQRAEKLYADHPALIAAPLGMLFFGIVGLALGITSVKHSTRGNWRGILAIVVCGLFVVSFCGINAWMLAQGGVTG